ncbi:copper transporter [Corynebacterium alimapuense]|uniref:Copper transporter n=1 Tax=Corynebacterium alimapuense TaxID=1576874 RepID=A0A3M8K9F7_9CORY|nr:copper transporter [Corynebacterium alimapuense]RNE49088.1 hypothetical protein C5L39_01470 [Corynebacterium alimapuense]
MGHNTGRPGWVVAGLGFGIAAGVAFGTLVLAPNMADGIDQSGEVSAAELDETTERAEIAEAQADSADSVISELLVPSVAGSLDGRPVLLMTTDDADEGDVGDVEKLLVDAGALDAGTISLREQFFSREGADQLKSIVTSTLPAGAQLSTDNLDPGVHAGESLGSALLLNPASGEQQASSEERALLLGALQEAGYLEFEEGTILPAQVIIVLTGDSDGSGDAGFASNSLADFAEALDTRGNGTVLAGRIHTAADTGAIGILRSEAENGVSTVDSLDRAWAQMATVLAARDQLAGESGNYGSAESAEAATPAP